MSVMYEDYIVTAHHSGLFDVYNELNGRRYEVDINTKTRSCTCPHWLFRLKKSKGVCKHIKMAKAKGGWNGNSNS